MRSSITVLFACLYWTALSSARQVYKAVGDTVVLDPGHAEDHITSITWKYGDDMVVQWDGEEAEYYLNFGVHSMLNTSTGELTIRGLNQTFSGDYTAEINNKVMGTTELLVISPVLKPTVSMLCNPEMTTCNFTCEGNTKDAEPITFQWRANGVTLSSTSVYILTQEDQEPSFHCMLENPVSHQSSDPVPNPFIPNYRSRLIPIIPLFVILLLILLFIIYRHVLKRNPTTMDATPQGTPGEMSAMLPQTQDPTSVLSGDAPNPPPEISPVQEPSTAASVHSNGAPVTSEAHGPLTENQTCPAPSDDSKEAEKPPGVVETSSENQTCATSPDGAGLKRSESSTEKLNGQEEEEGTLSSDQQPAGDLPDQEQN